MKPRVYVASKSQHGYMWQNDVPVKRKRTKCPATQLTLRHLEAAGWLAVKVESPAGFRKDGRFIPTKDLIGWIDVLAFKGGEVLAVQTTSAANVASRVRKIAESPYVSVVRAAGWSIIVHGWRQDRPGGRWYLHREIDCS